MYIVALMTSLAALLWYSSAKDKKAWKKVLQECPDGDYSRIVSDDVRELLKKGHRLRAMKKLRIDTGIGLAHAKGIINVLEKETVNKEADPSGSA